MAIGAFVSLKHQSDFYHGSYVRIARANCCDPVVGSHDRYFCAMTLPASSVSRHCADSKLEMQVNGCTKILNWCVNRVKSLICFLSTFRDQEGGGSIFECLYIISIYLFILRDIRIKSK